MPEVVVVFALEVEMHLLRRRHVYLYGVAKDRFVAHPQFKQLRHLDFIPDGVLALAVRAHNPFLVLAQKVLKHPVCLDDIGALVHLALFKLLCHRIEGAVGIPAGHTLQHVHRRELHQVGVIVRGMLYALSIASRRGVYLLLGFCVELREKPPLLVVYDVITVVEFRSEAHGGLIEVLKRADIHVCKFLVVQSRNYAFEFLRGQKIRVVLFGLLVHFSQIPPRRLVLIAPVHLVRGVDCIEVDIAEDVVPGFPKLLRGPVLIPRQPAQLIKRLLLELAKLAVLPLPLRHCLAAFALARLAVEPANTFPLAALIILFALLLRHALYALSRLGLSRPSPLVGLPDALVCPASDIPPALPGSLALLLYLDACPVSELDFDAGGLREGTQIPVQLIFKLIEHLVLADILLSGEEVCVFGEAHLLVSALFGHLDNALNNRPRVCFLRVKEAGKRLAELRVPLVSGHVRGIIGEVDTRAEGPPADVVPVVAEVSLCRLVDIHPAADHGLAPDTVILVRRHGHDARRIEPVEELGPVSVAELAVFDELFNVAVEEARNLRALPLRYGELRVDIPSEILRRDNGLALRHRPLLPPLPRLLLLPLRRRVLPLRLGDGIAYILAVCRIGIGSALDLLRIERYKRHSAEFIVIINQQAVITLCLELCPERFCCFTRRHFSAVRVIINR